MRLLFKLGALVIVGFIAFLVLINLWDEPEARDSFTASDLPAASLGSENGFYSLWLLGEPPDADITTDETRAPIRAMFDPTTNNSVAIKVYEATREARLRGPERHWAGLDVKFPDDKVLPGDEWAGFFETNRGSFVQQKAACAVLLDRYATLLAMQKVEDFTTPSFDVPLPNLVLWLRVAKLYDGLQLIRAADGDWQGAVTALLDQIDFCRRFSAHARPLVTNLVTRAVMNVSLQALDTLLSRPDCPAPIATHVLGRLPVLGDEEFGLHNAFVFEYLALANFVDRVGSEGGSTIAEMVGIPAGFDPIVTLTVQRNRTKRQAASDWGLMLDLDRKAPYTWRSPEGVRLEAPMEGHLWWLRNAGGKAILTNANPSPMRAIYRTYRLKARYDMTRIAAELRARWVPGKPIRQILASLESHGSTDPFSGKQYLYSDERGVLYSIGPDRVDDKGARDSQSLEAHSDIIVPCVRNASGD